MAPHVSVLLVYNESFPMETLGRALNTLSLSAGRARTCQEAQHLIEATEPHIIFTDAKLPDGTWAEIVRCAEAANTPSSVIVISSTRDIHFYIKAMESGAFDFMMPPFETKEIDHVVKCAVSNVLTRRNNQMLALAAS